MGLPSQTALTKKAPAQQDCDYSFFATRGGHRELHRAALDVEHSIGRIPLRKDDLVVPVVPRCRPGAELLAEIPGTETESLFRHLAPGHDSFMPERHSPCLEKEAKSYGSRIWLGWSILAIHNCTQYLTGKSRANGPMSER